MASRAEEKQRRREERIALEQAVQASERRKRLIGVLVAAGLVAASIGAIVIVAAGGGGGGSATSSEAAFGPHYEGLDDRREAAGVPTMAEAQTVGAAHFHPLLEVYVAGKQVKVPVNIGIDPLNPPSEMAGLHTHDDTGTIHNEAGTSAKLSQFFAVWGVPFSRSRLGPYRASGAKRVRMWVDGKSSTAFGSLQLKDGQQIKISFDRSSAPPS